MSTLKYNNALDLYKRFKGLFIKISSKYPEKYRDDLMQEAYLFCDNVVTKQKKVGFNYIKVAFTHVCNKYKMSKEGIKSYKKNGPNSRTMIQLKEVELENIGELDNTVELNTDIMDIQRMYETDTEFKEKIDKLLGEL